MSCQHHSDEEFLAAKRMLSELLKEAVPVFPRGKISPDDQGELSFAVASDLQKRAVVVRFAKPVDWIGLDKKSALHLADLLTQRANDLK